MTGQFPPHHELSTTGQEAQRQLAESLGAPSYVDLTDEIARLEAARAASQERERQLRKALEQIEQLDRMGHNSEVAAEMGYIARKSLAAYDEEAQEWES